MEHVQRSDVSSVVVGQVENRKWTVELVLILFIAAAANGGSNAFAHLLWRSVDSDFCSTRLYFRAPLWIAPYVLHWILA